VGLGQGCLEVGSEVGVKTISNTVANYELNSTIMAFDIRCSECNKKIEDGVKFDGEFVLCKKCLKEALEIAEHIE